MTGRARPSGIDAVVAAHAAHAAQAPRAVVFTTDPSDLRLLLDGQPHVAVDSP